MTGRDHRSSLAAVLNRRSPLRRALLVVPLVVALTACTDDGYSAPDREVSFSDIVGDAGTTQALSLDAQWYEQAVEDMTGILDFDAKDPAEYLDGSRPHPDVVDFIVVCAWADAAAAGEVPDDDAEPLLDNTGDTGCAGLSPQALSVAVGRLAPVGDEEDRPLLLDRITLERAIFAELAPEIAEAVAD